MLSRRTIILGAAGHMVLAAPFASSAEAPIRVIYVGGLDCRPCETWKKKYKADWLASPEYRQVTWIEIESPKLKEAYQERFWPGALRPVLDQLPRKSGTPRFLLVRDDRVIANEFGVGGWTKILDELKKELTAGVSSWSADLQVR
jgi:hypothetical protein